jgi:lysozyme
MKAGARAVGFGVTGAGLAALAAFVGYHEGYIPHTYADPVGIPTICYGHTGAGRDAGAHGNAGRV